MSLCPSSSHQLVAAAIAFRRARRKFPKDFGLESAVERASGSTKTQETATSREGPINQTRSTSSALVRRACNSRSDHVCPASVRTSRDYDRFCGRETSVGCCSCCRARNVGEDNSELRDECSGGDAVDTVPSKEYGEFSSSGVDRENGFAKPVDRDRCDEVTSRTMDDGEAVRTIPQPAHPTTYHHCKACCSSLRPRSNVDPANPSYSSASHERHDGIACGDFTGDRIKEFASISCHGASIDLEGDAEDPGDARGRVEDEAWTRANRKIVDSTWRCQCECHPCEDPIPNLSRSPCDRCHHGGCYRRHDCDCSHRHCCYHQRDSSFVNVKGCETRGSGEKARHKSWRDQMRGENGRLYARQCYSKEYSGIIPASCERNDEQRREKKDDDDDDDDNEDEDDDGGVAVINHKDSMCILAEKYKAGRKWRGGRCGDRERSDDRAGKKDECNKSLTLEIIDQPESPPEIVNAVSHEGKPSVKRVPCRAHCESCGMAKTCARGCGRHGPPPEGEFDRLRSPLNEATTAAATTRCCLSRAPCKSVF
ncbi:uncharacterized protein LOC105830127 [Monomorium pharaonis]|uniref:uncharacterized protein LOC105830127 n=1 Tax=Monomorium pharaonis TaxID=307658 RepID=UPI00102E15D1|nr:uncharacterized protein LOC105830127 [Monomorium pharaonis]